MTAQPTIAYALSENGETYPLTWAEVEFELASAQMYWITSLQEGIPHSVPVIGTWHDGAFYSCNPRSEQKYTNFKSNPIGQVLIGGTALNSGFNIAVNGVVEEMTEMEDRVHFGEQMTDKYPPPWRFQGTEEDMWVYRLVPTHVRAFHRMNPLASARFDFEGK